MALENVFSWSKSRAEQFDECRRKYFYDRYASWGGWDASAPKEARLAYILKNLKNRWAWKGETVHHIIEHTLKELRSGKAINPSEVSAHLTDVMRANYRSSKSKKYLSDPKKSLGLFEHEYEKPVEDDVWKKIHDESDACLKHFLNSELYRELQMENKANWLVIEDLEEFEYDKAKIYVKLDFARKKNGLIEIYDWKTGKDENAATVQMGAYAIYAMKKWSVPLDQIRTFLFYLSSDKPVAKEHKLTEGLIEETKRIMSESIAGMREQLLDPVRNIPKPREMFPFTENERFCNNCNFKKMCEKFAPQANRPS